MKEQVIEKLQFYSDKLGVPMPKQLFFHEKDYEEYVVSHYKDHVLAQELSAGQILGNNYKKGEAIFINLDQERYIHELETTCIHEILHTRLPKLEHGSQFNYHIKQIKGGNYTLKYGKLQKLKDWIG